jgi:hypothetical protein
MPVEPAFGASDRVPGDNNPPADDPNLPAELQGKTSTQIAHYYQERERGFAAELDTLRNAPPPQALPQRAAVAEPTLAEFYQNPSDATKKIGDERYVTKDQLAATMGNVGDTLVQTAKNLVKNEEPELFSRYEGEIDAIMSKVAPEARTNSAMWRTVFVQVKGVHARELMAEAEARGRAPAAERVSPSAGSPPQPTELSDTQMRVVNGLGITKEKYIEGGKHLAEGTWPLTMSNTGR